MVLRFLAVWTVLLVTTEAFGSVPKVFRQFEAREHVKKALRSAETSGARQRRPRHLGRVHFASSAASQNEENGVVRRLPASVMAILAATFLNLLGFTMAGPVTPMLANHFGLDVGARLGMLTSAYPVGMLFGLLLWPTMSDATGMRVPLLVSSLAGSGIGLSLQALSLLLSWPLWSFLALRTLTGAFAGASPIAKAYLADVAQYQHYHRRKRSKELHSVSGDDDLPRFLAYREASATLAFIAGPALGGLLYYATSSLAAVVGLTALASLAAATVVGLTAQRTSSDSKLVTHDESSHDDTSTMPLSCPLGTQLLASVASIVAISSLENAGSSTWDAFGAVVAKNNFDWGPRAFGALLTGGACASLFVSTMIFPRVVQAFGLVPTAVSGLLLLSSGLLGIGFSNGDPRSFVCAAALYQLGKPLYAPTLPTLLLRCVPPKRRGLAMGIDSAANTAARALAPILLGIVLHNAGVRACFSIASGLVFTAASIAAIRAVRVSAVRGLIRFPPRLAFSASNGGKDDPRR